MAIKVLKCKVLVNYNLPYLPQAGSHSLFLLMYSHPSHIALLA